MRIGIMLQSLLHFGGIGIYTRQIVKQLPHIDINNEYIMLYPSFGESSRMFGQFKSYNNVQEVYSKSLVPHALYWDNFVVPRVVKEYHIDLLFNPFLSVPFVGDVKKIFVMHGHEWFTMPEVFWLWERLTGPIRMKMVMKAADRVISISNTLTALLIRTTGLPGSKFTTIYHGVDGKFRPITNRSLLQSVKAHYALPEKFILFVGGLYPQKNFAALIEAFSLMARDIPHQLVVAGKTRWKYRRDLQCVMEKGLADRVQVLGWVDPQEIPALYSLADCFVYPSLYEGFGLCLVEAMACGCPTVAAATGALPEIAQDAAVLVDPHDYVGMKDAILRVIADQDWRQQLIQRGLVRAKDFTWEKCAEETLKVFYEVIAEA